MASFLHQSSGPADGASSTGDRGGRPRPVRKRTDLLLLDADPLEDVSAVSRIAGVSIRGRWVGAEEIQQRMRALAASFSTPDASPPGKR